ELDSWHRRIGLRTVGLDTSDDEGGTAFTIIINGVPVFVKGANWIPDDHLLTRITRDRLARRIDQAAGANLNLLRVWGGGIYESEDFYELCDERGLLVWQDFLLACFAYPEEEPHRSEFEAEAREHVTRLTAHPSLVLWNGGNENIWGHEDWGWKAPLAGRTWGSHYYYDLFPGIVSELAPTTPYSAGSPFSPRRTPEEMHPNDPDHGTHHQLEVWNRIDYTRYRDDIPRFCSEFGFQGPATWATIERAMRTPDGSMPSKDDDVWLVHQKAEDGNGKLDRGLAPHIGVPEDFADWHWATQLNQARAVAHAITHYRSWWPRSAGAIVWQLNDCWPVTSWAAVDGDERPKPLWWSLRAANADRLLTVQPRGEGEDRRDVLAVINDTGQTWSGTVAARRERLDGTPLASAELPISVAPRSVTLLDIPDDVRVPADPADEVLVVELDGERAVHCFVEDIELRLDPSPLEATAEAVDGGYLVHVRARSLAKDVAVFADRLDPRAEVDACLVTLPAGASTIIRVRTDVTGLEANLVASPVLRTANDLSDALARMTEGNAA
ncbi:MAG: glycoside hydrolase family 2 protein, partial [Arachnia sp.]